MRWTQGCPSVSTVGACRGRLLAGVTIMSVMPGPTQTNDPSHLGLYPAAGSGSGAAGDVEGTQLLAGGLRRQGVVKFFSGVGLALFNAGTPMFSGPWTTAPPQSGAVGFSMAYCVWQGVQGGLGCHPCGGHCSLWGFLGSAESLDLGGG